MLNWPLLGGESVAGAKLQLLVNLWGLVKATVRIGKLCQPVHDEFLVVQNLVSPVILGVDFMQQHGVVLDFSADPVGILFPSSTTSFSNRQKNPLVFATIGSDSQDADSDDVDMGDECAIPSFIDDGTVIPSCSDPVLMPSVIQQECLAIVFATMQTVCHYLLAYRREVS